MSISLVSTTVAPVSNVGYSAVSGPDRPSIDEVGNGRAQDQSAASSEPEKAPTRVAEAASAAAAGNNEQSSTELLEQQRILDSLSARDTEVRQHERAHQAASGGLAGAASYTFQRGPDGRLYAVGGEVSIDTSAVSGDPRATLEKAQLIIQAAMAPAEPSSQDYRVAASARAMAADARAQLQEAEESKGSESEEEVAEAEGEAVESVGAEQGSAGTQAVNNADTGRASGLDRDRGESALGSVERRLVESGAYSRMYPPGTLFSQQA